LVPKKLASFLVLSRELANSSNAEAMLRDLLTRVSRPCITGMALLSLTKPA
jgi:hypothetical protein